MKRVAITAVPLLITVLVWAISVPHLMWFGIREDVMQLFGALALVGFGTSMIIATRLPVVARLLGGQDKLTGVHKWLGVTAVGLVVVHLATRLVLFALGDRMGMTPGTVHLPFSEAAATMFVALIAFAFWARKVKYQTWLLVHKLMAVAYVCALAHYYVASQLFPFGLSPFSIWMDIMALVGVASAIYSVLVIGRRPNPTD